jgi:hypothetical protein
MVLDLVDSVGVIMMIFSLFCAFGHVRNMRCSSINNQLKHALGRFISFTRRFQCMITFIYLFRITIDSSKLVSASSI